MSRGYFRKVEGAPPPLRATAQRQVRFEEVDPLNVVWHGRYPSYFEDARAVFGEKYGFAYMDMYDRGIFAPLKKMHFDYFIPLRYPERFTIEAILHWTQAARLDFEYIIRNEAGEVCTTGYTVQMLVDKEMNLMLLPPPFVRDFFEKWGDGEIAG